MTTHDLKTWEPFYGAVAQGRKNFEVRKNDRKFREGDVLRLHQTPFGSNELTGESCEREVTYVLPGNQFGLQSGYVVMGLREVGDGGDMGAFDAACGRIEAKWTPEDEAEFQGHIANGHECVFPEEQEPSGRLILCPCLTCGASAMDGLADAIRKNRRLRRENDKLHRAVAEFTNNA